MTTEASRLPTRKLSVFALTSTGLLTVILSYLLAITVALGFFYLPVVLFVIIPLESGSFLMARAVLSVFGLVVGGTILWSLIPRKEKIEIDGVLVDLSQERELAREIKAIAETLREPMPSEVYLVAEANAFVIESAGFLGFGKRRILGLGLPLLQMLTIAQFRAVLAHEFAHYYSGDTRLGPLLYGARGTAIRAYRNLSAESEFMAQLRRWWIVAIPYEVLMGSMRMYWLLFMRVTQMISRRQEIRSDELACYIAGSQPLIEGLEKIRLCERALQTYWDTVIVPAAKSGYKLQLADGFGHFMDAPRVASANAEFLVEQYAKTKALPMDSHPPLHKRIAMAKRYNRPAPVSSMQTEGSDRAMISVIDQLATLESSLLKRLVPAVTETDLKPLTWEMAATEIHIPAWRKQVSRYLPLLATKTLSDFPLLVSEPRAITALLSAPDRLLLQSLQNAKAMEVLFCTLTLCLMDHGWKLTTVPGLTYLENGDCKVEPSAVISAIKSGKFAVTEWSSYRSERGIDDWPLAALASSPEHSIA